MARGFQFTDLYVKNLKRKNEGKEHWEREGKGFAIRYLLNGDKVWYYIYTFDGKKRFMRLLDGVWPDATLASARKAYDIAKVKVAEGIDPLAEKYEKDDARRTADTVKELVVAYIEKHAKVNKKKSWQEDERILNKDVLPVWSNRKACNVTRNDVMHLLDEMREQGRGNGIITNTFKIIRRMFSYAVKKQIVPATPCYAFEKGDELPRVQSRERTLSADEVNALWLGLAKTAISEDVRRVLKLILLTGQRPGEVASMHHDEISGKWWEFTPKETKITQETPRKQRIYLTDTALALIGKGEGYVFKCLAKTSPNEDGTLPPPRHITRGAISNALRRNLVGHEPKKRLDVKPTQTSKKTKKKPFVVSADKKLNIAHFTPHDLRRTCSTLISELGFTDAIVDAILAHLKKGEIRTYNKNKYDKEKQKALGAWDRKLTSIVTGKSSNVISINAQRKKAGNE